MDNKAVPYAGAVAGIGRVLQEINALGEKYGMFVLDMGKLDIKGGRGLVDVTLAFNVPALCEGAGADAAGA
jgi:hypothetical protein